jgi:hypothetical protein
MRCDAELLESMWLAHAGPTVTVAIFYSDVQFYVDSVLAVLFRQRNRLDAYSALWCNGFLRCPEKPWPSCHG